MTFSDYWPFHRITTFEVNQFHLVHVISLHFHVILFPFSNIKMTRFSSFRRLLTHLNMATMRVYPALTPLPQSQADELSIMSFNILTKAFAEKHYYRYISPLHAEWSYRHPILKEVLANYGVDILCLQECDPFSFHIDFGQYFRSELGYEFIIDSKDTKRAKYLNDPVAAAQIIRPSTLYKSDRFKVIHNEFRSRSIVTLFQIINENGNENEHRFAFIVNVHLEGAPKKWAVRFKQIKSILSRITFRCTELGLDPLTVPVIICGDFNDGMYSVITKVLIMWHDATCYDFDVFWKWFLGKYMSSHHGTSTYILCVLSV